MSIEDVLAEDPRRARMTIVQVLDGKAGITQYIVPAKHRMEFTMWAAYVFAYRTTLVALPDWATEVPFGAVVTFDHYEVLA